MRVSLPIRVAFSALLLLGVLVSLSFSQAKPSSSPKPSTTQKAKTRTPKPTKEPVAKPTPPPPDKAEPEPPAVECPLTVDRAPRLRGFYLNQRIEEITRVFPSFAEAYEKEKDPLMPVRTLTSDYRIVESDELTEDLTQMDEYRDVTFVWQLLNGRTVKLIVEYAEFEPASLKDFVSQIAESTSLPPESFKVTGKHKAVMACQGFTVEVNEGSYTKAGWVPTHSQISIEDKVAFEAMDAEEKELKRIAAEDAAKKKEEAEKRKRTFKP
jgi:DNA-directed RNA polymerase subunit H (RpoH/RPB5)